jgi:hypothetical protein
MTADKPQPVDASRQAAWRALWRVLLSEDSSLDQAGRTAQTGGTRNGRC